MLRYTTTHLPAARRLTFWKDLASGTFEPMEIYAEGDLDCSLISDQLGPLTVCLTSSNTSRLERTRSHIAKSTRRIFSIQLLLQGAYSVSSRRGETSLSEGEILIGDSAEPSTLVQCGSSTTAGILVPEHIMRASIPMPELLVGRKISGADGAGEVAASAIRVLVRQLQRGLLPTANTGVAEPLLSMIAAAYGSIGKAPVAETTTISLRRLRIVQYVEANIKDPRLSPATVAAHFRISKRYVRTIFEASGESLSQYILRRRLEGSAKNLRDPVWDKLNISSIACAWGFNSVGSFSRAFRSLHGRTPRRYRQLRHQLMPARPARGVPPAVVSTAA